MKVHCCQFDIAWEDKPANFAKVRALVAASKLDRGDLLVLPEMFSTGFSMNVAATSEQAKPGAEDFVRRLARQHGVYVVAGIVVEDGKGKGLNQAVVATPEGEIARRYSKIHPFSLGGETEHYARGSEIQTFDWNGVEVAPFVCYDLRFPELFRSAVRQGVEMFVLIANWPSRRAHHWVTLLQARAIENLAYVAGVNRCGSDPSLPYPGRTMIVDPHGAVLADAGQAEGVISAEIAKNAVTEWRRDFPALRDMHWTGA